MMEALPTPAPGPHLESLQSGVSMEEVLSILRTSASVSRFPRVDSETLFQDFLKRIPSTNSLAGQESQLQHLQQHFQRHTSSEALASPGADMGELGLGGVPRVQSLEFLRSLVGSSGAPSSPPLKQEPVTSGANLQTTVVGLAPSDAGVLMSTGPFPITTGLPRTAAMVSTPAMLAPTTAAMLMPVTTAATPTQLGAMSPLQVGAPAPGVPGQAQQQLGPGPPLCVAGGSAAPKAEVEGGIHGTAPALASLQPVVAVPAKTRRATSWEAAPDSPAVQVEVGPVRADPDPQVKAEKRRERRMLSNRESARRSRKRKQEHLETLEEQVQREAQEKSDLLQRLDEAEQLAKHLQAENKALRAEVAELRLHDSADQKGKLPRPALVQGCDSSNNKKARVQHSTTTAVHGSSSEMSS